MKIEKIAIFKNLVAQYNALHYFRLGLTKALEDQGIEVALIDTDGGDRQEFFRSIYINPPDFTLAFNGLMPMGGRFLCDEIQIPHVSWLVDSAHNFQMMTPGLFNIIISPDQLSADLFKKWGAPRSFFLPHAFDVSDTAPPGGERSLPIVFCGSLMDPLEVEELWKNSLPAPLVEDLKAAADEVILSQTLTYQQAFEGLHSQHAPFFNTLHPENMTLLIQSLDRYLRAKDRIEMLKSLAGFPVHIYGNLYSKRSWGDFLDLEKGSYHIHEALDFPEAVKVMKSAQIVLNSSPMFKTGAHERIFYGLGLGACVMTNNTPWIHSHFKENEELLIYKPNEKEKLRDTLAGLLSQPEALAEIARRGQAKVLKEHTWDVRSKELIAIMENEIETF
jgi:spore maturation protein CgeB